MSLKLYSNVQKLNADDVRVHQLSGDVDGIIAAYYDLSGNPSLFMSGASATLGNVGIKTDSPAAALTVSGDISASGSLACTMLQSSSGADLYISSNLVPTTSAFYIGDVNNPVQGIYISANSLHLGSSVAGLSGLGLSNVENTLTITGGVDCSAPVSATSFYGDASHLTNIPNIFNQSLNTTNNVSFSSLNLTSSLTAQNSTFNGTVSASGLISQAPNLCVIALTANQTLTTTTDTILNLTVKNDPNSWYVNANKSVKPTSAGYYNVVAMVTFDTASNNNNQQNIQIMKNSSTQALSITQNNTGQPQTMVAQATMYCNGTTDEIKLQGYTGHSSGQTVRGTSDGNWTKLEVIKIS